MALSFYKLFGYPTGVGALIARRDKLAKLQRPWFAGGTITVASVQEEGWYHLAPPPAGFEDGTLDYLSLPAVTIGIEYLEAVGIDVVHTRVAALSGWLLDESDAGCGTATALRLYVCSARRTVDRRGATIALYLLDPSGRPYDVYGVEASRRRAQHLRPHGVLLQPRRRRGGARYHARRHGALLPGRRRRS